MRYHLASSLTLALVAVVPTTAGAQDVGLQWTGCWALEGARSETTEADAGSRLVCVSPTDHGLSVSTRVDGEEVRRDDLDLHGTGRTVDDGGCTGVEQAFPSATGDRLFTTSDLRCEGGSNRLASGISALLSPDAWIDIQVIRVGDERELMVRRFRFDEPASRALWAADGVGDLDLAARTARTAAAAAATTEDVIEAAQYVDTAAIEAWLIESEASFALDGNRLMALADANVAPELIDLMVALSFPDYFVVNEDPEAPRGPGAYGYPVSFYGYYSPAFAPFGWGYSYSYWRPGYPIYPGYPGYPGVRPPGGTRYGGRVVNGKGYARVATNPDAPSESFTNFLRNGGRSSGNDGRNGGNGGSVSRGGSSSGGSKAGTTRTAKPRTAKRRGDGNS